MTAEFLLQSGHLLELNISPGVSEEAYERLAAGITGLDPDPNDEIAQDKYLDGGGFAETDVIGAQLILSLTGHRKYGDPVQDFIFSLLLEVGPKRRTDLRWTLPNGDLFEGPITIANITGPGGEAGNKGDIGFELHFNGKPEFTAAGDIEVAGLMKTVTEPKVTAK